MPSIVGTWKLAHATARDAANLRPDLRFRLGGGKRRRRHRSGRLLLGCRDQGKAHDAVVRILPPLNVTRRTLDQALEILGAAIAEAAARA